MSSRRAASVLISARSVVLFPKLIVQFTGGYSADAVDLYVERFARDVGFGVVQLQEVFFDVRIRTLLFQGVQVGDGDDVTDVFADEEFL